MCSWLLICTAWIPSAALVSSLVLHWLALWPRLPHSKHKPFFIILPLSLVQKTSPKTLPAPSSAFSWCQCLLCSLLEQHHYLQCSLHIFGVLFGSQGMIVTHILQQTAIDLFIGSIHEQTSQHPILLSQHDAIRILSMGCLLEKHSYWCASLCKKSLTNSFSGGKTWRLLKIMTLWSSE